MSGQRSQTVKFGVMHTVAYKGDVVLLSVSIDTARLIQRRGYSPILSTSILLLLHNDS